MRSKFNLFIGVYLLSIFAFSFQSHAAWECESDEEYTVCSCMDSNGNETGAALEDHSTGDVYYAGDTESCGSLCLSNPTPNQTGGHQSMMNGFLSALIKDNKIKPTPKSGVCGDVKFIKPVYRSDAAVTKLTDPNGKTYTGTDAQKMFNNLLNIRVWDGDDQDGTCSPQK